MSDLNDDNPFVAACLLASDLGAANISATPGCWELLIDDAWYVAINPHGEDTLTTIAPRGNGDAPPVAVPPKAAYVAYNGWPAGIVDYHGGTFAAGTGANPAAFARACRARAEAGS